VGLEKASSSGLTYLVIKHGSICEESRKPREGWEPVEVEDKTSGDKQTKYICRYRAVEGLICDIVWYDTKDKFKTRFQGWKVYINADGTGCVLDFPLDSPVGRRFMKTIRNIDISEPVRFSAWKGDNDKIALSIKQHDEKVAQFYTRENEGEPGGCPKPVQDPVTEKWDYSGQRAFLFTMMRDMVLPHVQEVGNKMPGGAAAKKAGGLQRADDEHVPEEPDYIRDHTDEPDLSDDDIPF
jgi:hypothetical protein